MALRRLHLAASDADAAIARRMGLRALDMAAMIHITAGAPIGPKDLSTRLAITPGAATELTDRLEQAGHVVRTPDPVDRRRVQLLASGASRALIREELDELIDGLDRVIETFDPAERDAIERYLKAAAQSLSAFATDPGE
jgi:DNA-binding MarR family transcriptional regulator